MSSEKETMYIVLVRLFQINRTLYGKTSQFRHEQKRVVFINLYKKLQKHTACPTSSKNTFFLNKKYLSSQQKKQLTASVMIQNAQKRSFLIGSEYSYVITGTRDFVSCECIPRVCCISEAM